MSEGLDISEVRKTYSRYSDQDLVRLAEHEARSLTPGAREAIREELRARGLDSSLAAVDAQDRNYTLAEIDALCESFRNLPCPACGMTGEPLNATKVSATYSFIIMTQSRKRILIACPQCLAKANKKALVESSLLGWWGLPWGIIRTIQSIAINLKGIRLSRQDTVSDHFRQFVAGNIALVQRYRNEPKALEQMIAIKK